MHAGQNIFVVKSFQHAIVALDVHDVGSNSSHSIGVPALNISLYFEIHKPSLKSL